MDSETLEFYTKLGESVTKDDWRKALNFLFSVLRKNFVFDNLAIYLVTKEDEVPEAVYARSVGRGRSQEAEASWGEEIANQVITTNKIVTSIPSGPPSADRLTLPYLLGLPLNLQSSGGVIVFVRFGGPEYKPEQMAVAEMVAALTARIFERRSMAETQNLLELARQRAQFQDDFIATISHELHTPLGFIKGYTTSLLRSDTTWDTSTQREFLTIIDEESDHLVRLIDRILDSARLQSGTMAMDFQPVRLDSLLRDILTRLQNRHKDLVITQDIMPASPIQADSVRLAQVFGNLLDNAIKYAPGSKLVVSLRVYPENQIVTVSDQGPGISSEHLPFLFERFYRAAGHPNKRGTGLGLFICKQIVEAHHGQISVNTAPGKGTAFVVDLPVGGKGY